MKRTFGSISIAAAIVGAPASSLAQGNLAAPPAEVVTLSITGANAALSAGTFEFVTGEYSRLNITSDGLAGVQSRRPRSSTMSG